MKAVVFDRFGGPEVLRYADLPVPAPGEGQVLVKMAAAGVCKADWRVRTGRCQWLTCPFPATLGYEGAGTVAALGRGDTGFAVGRPVHVLHMACYGTYTEYMAVTADDVVEIPEGVDFAAAACAFNYFVAWGLLHQIVDAKQGQDSLHRGRGRRDGHSRHPTGATDRHERHRQRQHRRQVRLPAELGGRERLQPQSREQRGGGQAAHRRPGSGLCLRPGGRSPGFCRQLDMLATYGQIILYKYLGGYPEDKEIVHILQSRCEGCYGIRYFSIHVHDTDPEGFKKVKRQVLGLMAEGKRTPPIYQVLPLAEAARAHEMIEAGEVLGKLILRIES